MWISLMVVLSSVASAATFMWDDPCFVMPDLVPDNPNPTMNVTIPSQCKNGTLDWNYPQGHLLLYFDNRNEIAIRVCIRDYIGGTVFTITDMINKQLVGAFDNNNWACTESTKAKEMILKVDAPPEQRYMGGFSFRIDHKILTLN